MSLPRIEVRDPGQAGLARFAAYEEFVSPLWAIATDADRAAQFRWSSATTHLGPAVVGWTQSSGHSCERTAAQVGRMGLDHIVVLLRRSGLAHLETDAGSAVTGGGDLTFVDLSRPMRATTPEVDTVSFGFSRAAIALLVRDVDALHGLVLRPDTALGRLAASHVEALAREAPHLAPADAAAVSEASIALLAVCAERSLVEPAAARVRARPALLLTVRRFIEANLSDTRLSAERISEKFALSRSTMYRLFQPLGGVDRYIRRRRLARAHRLLSVPPGESAGYVYEVALSCGFGSESAFSHAFRREFSQSPLAFLRDADRVEPMPAAQGMDLSGWLQDLAP
jgi:AraC-like DNA-binding protein